MAEERFRAQAEAFIAGVIKAEIPDISVDEGTAVSALIVKSGSVITAALSQEIEHVVSARDISDPEAISTSDMDKNLENLLVTRNNGGRSQGPMNIHFPDRKKRTLTAGLRVSSKDGSFVYALTSDLVFNEFDYISNTDDGTYYVRASFEADTASDQYDLDIGQINVIVDNTIGASYVRNPEKFQNGETAQTNTEFLRAATRALSTRLPITVDGSTFLLQQLFGLKLLDVVVAGNGDAEMLRDELHRDGLGALDLVPTGTPSGIHIGGRQDIYHWYKRVNYIEVTVDLSVDLVLVGSVGPGAMSVIAGFAAGTTTQNSVPLTGGKIILDLGAGVEETVEYASAVLDGLTQQYTFTLVAPGIVGTHAAGASVKTAGDGRILIGLGAKIDALPVLRVQSVTLLDPLTLAPISTLSNVDATSRDPGWYMTDINKFNHMSAKETKTLVVDEKRGAAGNAALSAADGDVDATLRTLTSASSTFTGYQGRDVVIAATGGDVTAVVSRVVSPTVVELAPGVALVTETGRSFSIAAGFGDFVQFAVRVGYYTHVEAQSLQSTLDGGRSRVAAGNSLSRLFYPVFLDFRLRYRGPGTTTALRESLLKVIQQSQGTAFGLSEGAKFEVSDLVAAAYGDGNADYVETPFEIRVTRVTPTGAGEVFWVAPGPTTVNDLVVATTAVSPGDTTVRARVPVGVAAFAVPARGNLFLGAFTTNSEQVTYDRFTVVGDDILFVLTEGVSVGFAHAVSEPLRVSVREYDPDNVITDGVLSDDRLHRPYFGTVVVEKLT